MTGTERKRILRAAATATAPVFFGYLFVGLAFGLLMQKSGYGGLWAAACSLFVYAGSMQFVLVGLLLNPVGLLQTAVVTLAVNIRHAFYGLSMLEKFRAFGRCKPYMIFSLTDETYSLLCGVKPPEGVPEQPFYFWISLLDHCYWVLGSLLGSTVGALLPFDSTGIDFALTALFVVIFTEQWLTAASHLPALVGLGCGAGCLLLLGPENFLPPALLLTVAALVLGRGKLEPRLAPEEVPQS